MNDLNRRGLHRSDDAAARVMEISELFASIRQTLEQMRQELETSPTASPKATLSKISDLQSAHLKMLAAEEAFHAQQDASGEFEEIDTDAIRADIGRQLARIRAARDAGGFPCDID